MRKKLFLILSLALVCQFLFVGCADFGKKTDEPESESETQVKVLKGTPGLSYTLMEDGTYSVALGGAINQAVIVIPATINGKPVSTVAASGFKESASLVRVVIADGVKVIQTEAFEGCYNLKTVDLGNGVQTINSIAFSNSGIQAITLPDSLTQL